MTDSDTSLEKQKPVDINLIKFEVEDYGKYDNNLSFNKEEVTTNKELLNLSNKFLYNNLFSYQNYGSNNFQHQGEDAINISVSEFFNDYADKGVNDEKLSKKVLQIKSEILNEESQTPFWKDAEESNLIPVESNKGPIKFKENFSKSTSPQSDRNIIQFQENATTKINTLNSLENNLFSFNTNSNPLKMIKEKVKLQKETLHNYLENYKHNFISYIDNQKSCLFQILNSVEEVVEKVDNSENANFEIESVEKKLKQFADEVHRLFNELKIF